MLEPEEKARLETLEKSVEALEKGFDTLLRYCRAIKAQVRHVSASHETAPVMEEPEEPKREHCAICDDQKHFFNQELGRYVKCECEVKYQEVYKVYETKHAFWIKWAATEARRQERDLKKLRSANAAANAP